MTINETTMVAIRVVFNRIKGTALPALTIPAGLSAKDTSKLTAGAKQADFHFAGTFSQQSCNRRRQCASLVVDQLHITTQG
jgi:hypothetical protein